MSVKRETCPDCLECQGCSETRCRQCRKGRHPIAPPELGPVFSHGDYLAWREKKRRGDPPSGKSEEIFVESVHLDGRHCTDCDSCIAVCPEVFHRNPDTLMIETREADPFPADNVAEAMAVCPGQCITLEEP